MIVFTYAYLCNTIKNFRNCVAQNNNLDRVQLFLPAQIAHEEGLPSFFIFRRNAASDNFFDYLWKMWDFWVFWATFFPIFFDSIHGINKSLYYFVSEVYRYAFFYPVVLWYSQLLFHKQTQCANNICFCLQHFSSTPTFV